MSLICLMICDQKVKNASFAFAKIQIASFSSSSLFFLIASSSAWGLLIVLLDKVGTTKIIFHLMQKLSPSSPVYPIMKKILFKTSFLCDQNVINQLWLRHPLSRSSQTFLKGSKNQGHHHSKHTWSIKIGYSNWFYHLCSWWLKM